MYPDAPSFLAAERDGLRPYEQLLALTDAQLDRPVAAAHGWSGRDLLGHIVLAQEAALAVAGELADGLDSPTMAQAEADWPTLGDAINEAGIVRFRAMPIDAVRAAFLAVPDELRRRLAVVPSAHWIEDPVNQDYFLGETIRHYEDHLADLTAILDAAGE